jgi:hypothetical protein
VTRAECEEIAGTSDLELTFFDGFDDCILGLVRRFSGPTTVLYDRAKCIDALVKDQGMTHEEAEEWMGFNVEGAWVGESTPSFALTQVD